LLMTFGTTHVVEHDVYEDKCGNNDLLHK
jgi:hypothetical protein